jgi:hypothetical protein
MLPASAAVITIYAQEDGSPIVGLTFGIGSAVNLAPFGSFSLLNIT